MTLTSSVPHAALQVYTLCVVVMATQSAIERLVGCVYYDCRSGVVYVCKPSLPSSACESITGRYNHVHRRR